MADGLNTVADLRAETGAEALLMALRAVGVDYLFANAGTDFPPVIEGMARLGPQAIPQSIPVPVTVPHEIAAVGMAHGFWLVTGRAQAVMVHVNVGLANAVMGVINAASDDVPVLVLSGRTPITETGRVGARATPIQYGQEMYDQTSLVRDVVKFSYEMRFPEQGDTVVKRAAALAVSAPAGPVYISLPREPLSDILPAGFAPAPVAPPATLTQPDPAAITTLAGWLAGARMPVVLCQRCMPPVRRRASCISLPTRCSAACRCAAIAAICPSPPIRWRRCRRWNPSSPPHIPTARRMWRKRRMDAATALPFWPLVATARRCRPHGFRLAYPTSWMTNRWCSANWGCWPGS